MNVSMQKIDIFGPNAVFEHIGIALKQIKDVSKNIDKIQDKIQNVNLGFIDCNGLTVELVEPIDVNSPINSFIEKNQTYYHICFSVPDLDESIASAKKYNFVKISKPVPAIAFDNRRIVWLYNIKFGLVELLEN